MTRVKQLLLRCFPYLALIESFLSTVSVALSFPTALPGCPEKCGNITIPFPFGIRPGCFRDRFDLTCNESTSPPKVFMSSNPASNVELLEINITSGEARVYKRIGYQCYSSRSNVDTAWHSYMSLADPYLFSNKRNKFTVIGCYTLAYIVGDGNIDLYKSGCMSFCSNSTSSTADDGRCNGLGCCQTSIPEGLSYYSESWGYENNSEWQYNPCNYAVLVEEDWYKFQVQDLRGYNFLDRTDQKRVPIILDWAIRRNGTCLNGVENSTDPACLSNNSGCYNTSNGEGYLCQCLKGYVGNPYLAAGCIDIDECNSTDNYPCSSGANCINKGGGYICSCPKGTKGNPYFGKDGICMKNPEKFPYPARLAILIILGVVIFLGLCFLIATYRQHKRYLREKKEYQRYYEMMDNQLRVFSRKQIANATDYFNESRVLGRGGQGNVYKGLLENNQVVAIKKAKEVEETQKGEFVNEIILLSQLNHKNIVRLLGCCLEVKIPMLVYEYVPNGSLFELLHRKSNRRPISLGTRLKIALESAIALDYLHSSVVRSIIHGDVKSANILLDANYNAKVSDFGASSIVPVNEIVELVHFSHGYLDPECLYTQILTKNSDVYSFGIVILELLTGKEAIYVDEKGEKQPLATCFLSKAKKNEHSEMLDKEIVANDENVMELLDEICVLVVQCLSPKGEDRPTMRHVAEELQKMVRFYDRSTSWKLEEEEMENLLGDTKFSSISDASGFNHTQYSAVLEMEAGAPR